MKAICLAVVAFVSLLLSFGCQPDDPEIRGQIEPVTAAQPIVNGTRDPQAVPLTDSQIMALGWLHPAGAPSQAFCTATLVAPDLVVTARHCTFGASGGQISFGVGRNPDDPDAVFGSSAIYPNRRADAALIVLNEDATAGDVAITPIPVNPNPVDESVVGRAVQVGGYGDTYDPLTDGRWFATVYVYQVGDEEIIVDGRGEQGICYGDSGGPLIDLDADGNPVVLAVESWGDETCVDIDHMTRLDPLYDDWVGPILDGEVPEDPCDGLDRTGRCDGDLLEWCGRNELRQTDCAELGTVCTYVEDAGRYACACGDVDFEGRCAGDVLEYCDDGRLRQINCGVRGLTCGFSGAETGYVCLDSVSCRPEDEPGRCDGDVAIACSAGVTTRKICYVDGGVCVESEDGATCELPDEGDDSTGDGAADAGNVDFPDMGDVAPETQGGGPSSPTSETAAEDEGCGCASSRGVGAPSVLSLAFLALLLGWRARRR